MFLHRPLLAVLYIVPVALAGFWSRSNQPSRVVVVTGFCTLLVGAGLLVLPSLDSILLTDRLLVLATIWITAILSLLRKKQEELDLLRGMLPLCASCKKIRDTTGYWEQLESVFAESSSCGVQPTVSAPSVLRSSSSWRRGAHLIRCLPSPRSACYAAPWFAMTLHISDHSPR